MRILVDTKALRHPVLPLGRNELREVLEQVLDRLALPGAGLELRITSDQAIAALHNRHLGCLGPTNVLAFPANEPALGAAGQPAIGPGIGAMGAIALNADAVLREANLYRQDPFLHFIRLVTHALLHLAGFEHGLLMDDLTESVVDHFATRAMETH